MHSVIGRRMTSRVSLGDIDTVFLRQGTLHAPAMLSQCCAHNSRLAQEHRD